MLTSGHFASRSQPSPPPDLSKSNDGVNLISQRSTADKGHPQLLTVSTCKTSSLSSATTVTILRGTSGSKPKPDNVKVHPGTTTSGIQKDPNLGIAVVNTQRKSSVFVSRLESAVSARDLLDYIHSTFDLHENFLVEEQSVRSGHYIGVSKWRRELIFLVSCCML